MRKTAFLFVLLAGIHLGAFAMKRANGVVKIQLFSREKRFGDVKIDESSDFYTKFITHFAGYFESMVVDEEKRFFMNKFSLFNKELFMQFAQKNPVFQFIKNLQYKDVEIKCDYTGDKRIKIYFVE